MDAEEFFKQLSMCNPPWGMLKAMMKLKVYDVGEKSGTIFFGFSGSRKANACKVKLVSDLYQIEFIKMDKYGTQKVVKVFEDVFCDQVKPIFEEFTGLYTAFQTNMRWS